MKNEGVSVIVPSKYESNASLGKMLSCTIQQLRPGDQVVVVDGSSDGRDFLKHQFSRSAVEVVWPQDDGTGIAGARNSGFEATSNEILIYIDGDCLPAHGYIDALRRLATSSDQLIQAGFKSYTDRNTLGYQHQLWRDVVRGELAKQEPALVVNGRGFAVKKSLAKRLGDKPFEVNATVHGGEDLLFGHQLTKARVGINLKPEIFSVNYGDPVGLKELSLQKFVHGRGDAVRGVLPSDTFDEPNFNRTVLAPIERGVKPELALTLWMHYLLGAYIGDKPASELANMDILKLGIFDAMPKPFDYKNMGIKIELPESDLSAHPY